MTYRSSSGELEMLPPGGLNNPSGSYKFCLCLLSCEEKLVVMTNTEEHINK